MKKCNYYGVSLCAGLLGFHTLTSCVNTRKELGLSIWPSSKTFIAIGAATVAIARMFYLDPNNNNNPIMFINGETMKLLEKNDYSLISMQGVVDKRLNINAENENGDTIPHLLLKKVIEEFKSKGLFTSHHAMQIEVVLYFLKNGANPYIENDQGETMISLIDKVIKEVPFYDKKFFEIPLQEAKKNNFYGKFHKRSSREARKNNAKYNASDSKKPKIKNP